MSNTITRGLTALAVGGLTSLALALPAQAADCPAGTYPPSNTCLPAEQTGTDAPQGGTITFVFTGFKPFSTVDLYLHSTPYHLGVFTADKSGTVTVPVKVPTGFDPGQHTVSASGVDPSGQPRTMTAALKISAATPTVSVTPTAVPTGTTTSGSDLPRTGLEIGAAALLGAGLLGAGSLMVVSGRKRRATLAAV